MITAAGPCESDMIPGPFNLLTAAVHGSAPPAAGGAAEATVTVRGSDHWHYRDRAASRSELEA